MRQTKGRSRVKLQSRGGTQVVATVVLGSLLAALAACGDSADSSAPSGPVEGDWSAVVEAAEKEGSVDVAHAADPAQLDRVIGAFNEKYPKIKVNIVRGSTELYAQMDAAIANKLDGMDVVIRTEPPWFTKNADAFASIGGPDFAAYPSSAVQVADKAATATIAPQSTIIWNTNTFPDGFEDFPDIAKYAQPGQYGARISPPITSNTAQYYQFLENNYGEGLFEDLAALEPKIYPSSAPLAQAVAAGEVGVADNVGVNFAINLKEQGAPIDFVLPDPGYGTAFMVAALAHSKQVNASRVFVDFLLSKDGQTAMNSDGYGGSPLNVDGDIDTTSYVVYDPANASEEFVAEWEDRIGNYFG